MTKKPNDTKHLRAAAFLLETIGADRISQRNLRDAACAAEIDAVELISAMKWLSVGKDAQGFFLPNQIVLALHCLCPAS